MSVDFGVRLWGRLRWVTLVVDVGSDFVVDSGGGPWRWAMGPNCWWILVVDFGGGLWWWALVVGFGGGRFLCLEFSRVDSPVLSSIYDRFSFGVLPVLGRVVAGDEEAYRYLVESIRKFPSQAEFSQIIRDAGFKRVSFRDLSGGIAAIHSGWRI